VLKEVSPSSISAGNALSSAIEFGCEADIKLIQREPAVRCHSRSADHPTGEGQGSHDGAQGPLIRGNRDFADPGRAAQFLNFL
jgi:hypothetical protein